MPWTPCFPGSNRETKGTQRVCTLTTISLKTAQVSKETPKWEIASGIFLQEGYLKRCSSLSEVRKYLGGEPVVNKLGAIESWKTNPTTGEIRKKLRLILDNRQSGVTGVAERSHRSTLPRATHAVRGILGLMEPTEWHTASDEEVWLLIADISDAFWLIPLHPSERRFFVAGHGEYLSIFLRTAQGSRGAPLTWAALAALLARCVQGLFAVGNEDEARLQGYVDDPLMAVRGRY